MCDLVNNVSVCIGFDSIGDIWIISLSEEGIISFWVGFWFKDHEMQIEYWESNQEIPIVWESAVCLNNVDGYHDDYTLTISQRDSIDK